MEQFLQQHAASVTGALSGWDRLRFRGTLRMLDNVTGLGRFLSYTGRLFKDFAKYAHEFSQQTRSASLAMPPSRSFSRSKRPVHRLDSTAGP